MKYLKYVLGILCLIMSGTLLFTKVDVGDVRTAAGILFLLVADIFLNFKKED